MTDMPKFDDGARYLVSAEFLATLERAIIERTPIAGDGLTHRDTPQGRVLTLREEDG